MFKYVAIVWWAAGLIAFSLVALHGGEAAWVGIVLCAILLVLSIIDPLATDPKDPHDWSV